MGATEPFRARLPGLAAMWLPPAGGPKKECVAVPPAARTRTPCGVPPFDPAHCRAQGCCYGPFSPDPHSYPSYVGASLPNLAAVGKSYHRIQWDLYQI